MPHPPRPLPVRLALASLAVPVALLLAGCAGRGVDAAGPTVAGVVTQESSPYAGAVELTSPYAEPQERFTDTTGEPFDFAADTRAPITLVFFGYTSCPDVCNTVLADAAMALRRVDPAVRAQTQLVFVTTDPERDEPAVIREYLDRFDPSFVGLTAPLPTIERVAESLGVALTGTNALPGGGYEVGHSAQLIAFGADGRGQLVWAPDRIDVGALKNDLTRFAEGQAGSVRP